MNKPVGFENMSPVRRALEVALHELTAIHGLRVTDAPDVQSTWEIDTSEATEIIEEALNSASSPMTAEDWKAALEVCESL